MESELREAIRFVLDGWPGLRLESADDRNFLTERLIDAVTYTVRAEVPTEDLERSGA